MTDFFFNKQAWRENLVEKKGQNIKQNNADINV